MNRRGAGNAEEGEREKGGWGEREKGRHLAPAG